MEKGWWQITSMLGHFSLNISCVTMHPCTALAAYASSVCCIVHVFHLLWAMQSIWSFSWFFLYNPSKIEWGLTNGPLSKLLEILDTQV